MRLNSIEEKGKIYTHKNDMGIPYINQIREIFPHWTGDNVVSRSGKDIEHSTQV
jgi:hypothetical protein